MSPVEFDTLKLMRHGFDREGCPNCYPPCSIFEENLAPTCLQVVVAGGSSSGCDCINGPFNATGSCGIWQWGDWRAPVPWGCPVPRGKITVAGSGAFGDENLYLNVSVYVGKFLGCQYQKNLGETPSYHDLYGEVPLVSSSASCNCPTVTITGGQWGDCPQYQYPKPYVMEGCKCGIYPDEIEVTVPPVSSLVPCIAGVNPNCFNGGPIILAAGNLTRGCVWQGPACWHLGGGICGGGTNQTYLALSNDRVYFKLYIGGVCWSRAEYYAWRKDLSGGEGTPECASVLEGMSIPYYAAGSSGNPNCIYTDPVTVRVIG